MPNQQGPTWTEFLALEARVTAVENKNAEQDGRLDALEGNPPPQPPTATFTATPASIESGQGSTLNWNTTNADTVTLDGAVVGQGGMMTIFPTADQTYTLIATGPGGSVTKTVTVTVTQPSGFQWPGPGSDVTIPAGTTVVVDTLTAEARDVIVHGVLQFSSSVNSKLTCRTLRVETDGELDFLTITNAELVIRDEPFDPADTQEAGNGLLVFGTIKTNGKVRTRWVALAGEPLAGDTVLLLKTPVSGWEAGDSLIISDTRQVAANESPAGADWQSHKEEVTLQSVSADGLSITLTAPLAFDHPGAHDGLGNLDFTGHVGNRTSNIVIRSENPAGNRGMAMFMDRANVDVQNVEFRDLGRTKVAPLSATNIKGRYAVHFHHCYGPTSPQANGYQFTFAGNAVHSTTTEGLLRRWGLSIHDSHYGLVQGSLFYQYGGWGIGTEDGSETHNVIENNYIQEIGSSDTVNLGNIPRADERGYNDPPGDWGFEGAGLWFRGPNNYVRGNVVANARIGCSYVHSSLNAQVNGTKLAPANQGEAPSVVTEPQFMPILQFENNEFYGGWMAQGFTIWDLGQQGAQIANPNQAESVLKNNSVWHVWNKAYYNYVARHVTFDGWKVRASFAKLAAGLGLPNGFYSGDYAAVDFKFVNCDIQGCRNGIDVGAMSILNYLSTMQIVDSHFSNYFNVVTTIGYSSGGAGVVRPMSVEMHNCTHTLPDMPDGIYDGLNRSFVFRNNSSNGPDGANYVAANDLRVYDHQGVVGDNFRVYCTGQDPSHVLPTNIAGGDGNIQVRGTPEAGTTNQYNHDKYEPWDYQNPLVNPPVKADAPNAATPGLCFAGSLSPTTAIRPNIIGYCEDI